MNKEQEKMNRRQFLDTAGRAMFGTLITSAGLTLAVEESNSGEGPEDLDIYDFVLPRIKYAHESKEVDRWNVRPGGDANLLKELRAVIRCKVKPINGADDWQPQWAMEGQ